MQRTHGVLRHKLKSLCNTFFKFQRIICFSNSHVFSYFF